MKKFWLIGADMGYGHQRAIFPLRNLAENGHILSVGDNESLKKEERKLWQKYLNGYEFVSRAGNYPLVGKWFKKILNTILHIPKFYPFRDLSKSTLQVSFLRKKIQKGLCAGVLETVRQNALPIVTSFYAPAIAADEANYFRIFCIITDVDFNRVWVAEKPARSQIEYFVPGGIAAKRLLSYGVADEKIHITGFPLPLELLGNRALNVLKKNLRERLYHLDPMNRFSGLHSKSVEYFLGCDTDMDKERNLTLTYAVGGAGAQKEIALDIIRSFKNRLQTGTLTLNLVAGTRIDVKEYFDFIIKSELGINANVVLIYEPDNDSYFQSMNKILHTTDILWTKPSELSFYCALGIPIVVSKPIGPQEKCNRRWLFEINAGIKQINPKYADEWISDMLINGRLAEAAWSGFLKARKYGTYKITDFLLTGKYDSSFDPLLR